MALLKDLRLLNFVISRLTSIPDSRVHELTYLIAVLISNLSIRMDTNFETDQDLDL